MKKGQKMTKEIKNKISLSKKKISEETRKKLSNSHIGKIGYWRGKKQPQEMILKRIIKLTGIKRTKETRKKLSLLKKGNTNGRFNKGLKRSQKAKENMSLARKKFFKNGGKPTSYWLGKKMSLIQRLKMSKSSKGKNMGDKNGNWLNGKSFEQYPKEFNNDLKSKIKERDNFQCQECYYIFSSNKLNIHHIDYNKKNNQENNLITLCDSCYAQTNYKRNNWSVYFKNKLETIYA